MRAGVLVVSLEDDVSTRWGIETWVRSIGCDFDSCATLDHLKKMWLKRGPDVVLLDIVNSVPEILSLIDWWREHQELEDTQVVIYSAAEGTTPAVIEAKGVPFWGKEDKDHKAFREKLSRLVGSLPPYRKSIYEDGLTVTVVPNERVVAHLDSDPNDQRRAQSPFTYPLDSMPSIMDSVLASPKWIELSKKFGGELYKAIFDPAISMLYGEALKKCREHHNLHIRIAVPEEYCASGFEALYNKDSQLGAQFVGQSHPLSCRISNIRGAGFRLSRQRFNRDLRLLKVLLVAANVHGNGLPRIPQVEVEVRQLANTIEEEFAKKEITAKVVPLRGHEATVEKFAEKLSEGFDVIHFAGHGIHCDGKLHESGLYLWSSKPGPPEPDLFDCARLRSLMKDSKCSLVFFSTCHLGSGGGPAEASRSLMLGVCHSMLQGGVGSVVAYRGVIDDDGPLNFATNFYTSLAKSGEPDIAMRNARINCFSDKSKAWLSSVLFDQA